MAVLGDSHTSATWDTYSEKVSRFLCVKTKRLEVESVHYQSVTFHNRGKPCIVGHTVSYVIVRYRS